MFRDLHVLLNLNHWRLYTTFGNVRNQCDNFWTRFEVNVCGGLDQLQSPNQVERMWIDNLSDKNNFSRRLYYESLDLIRYKIMYRFSSINQLDLLLHLILNVFLRFPKTFQKNILDIYQNLMVSILIFNQPYC